jgi:DNA-binding MarR family transcriptional regulator
VLAVQHLARAGELTPGQLATQLQLTSGGTTSLIHRLQRAGHITRNPHPRDRRSTILRLTPTIEQSATEAWAPLIAELDKITQDLPPSDHQSITRFLKVSPTRPSDMPTDSRETPTFKRTTHSRSRLQRYGRSRSRSCVRH